MPEESTAVVRCELQGCDAIIDTPTAGAKRQRYCSAAHRVSARQQRRAERIATQADRVAEPVAEPADVLRPLRAGHGGSPVGGPGADVATLLRRRADGTPAAARQGSTPANRRSALRRRAIAVVGVAAVLASGQQLVATSRNAAPNPPGGVTTGWPAAPDVRADRAAVERGLVLVNAQLDMITQTLDQWRLLHGPSTPPQVRALMERQRVVEQLKATVVSKLTAMDALERTAADRAAAEQALAAIDHALNTTPTPGLPQEADTVRQLTDQKKMWTQRREQFAAANVAAQRTVAEPMPDLSDRTSPLAQQVSAITGGPAPAPGDHRRRPQVAIAPREHAAEDRPPVYTSAPPRPVPLQPDAPPSRDASAAGERQARSAAAHPQTSPPVTSGRPIPPAAYADALDRAEQSRAATPPDRRGAPLPPFVSPADAVGSPAIDGPPAVGAGGLRPADLPHSQTRPQQAQGRPADSGPSRPPTDQPGWVQQARTHMDEDLAHFDHGSGPSGRGA